VGPAGIKGQASGQKRESTPIFRGEDKSMGIKVSDGERKRCSWWGAENVPRGESAHHG